jgi:DNA polymerase-3 subunit gamma/tau
VAAPTTAPVAGAVTLQHVRDAWSEILETVQRTKRSAWAVVYTSHPRALDGDVLTLSFVSRGDVETFRQAAPSGGGTSEVLRAAILSVLGIRVKFLPKVDGGQAPPEVAEPGGWTPAGAPVAAAPSASAPSRSTATPVPAEQRYGEAVVREILGASFLEETVVAPSEVG